MLLSAPAIILTAAATLLAVLVTFGTSIVVARARTATGIHAPAMSGDPRLERALRVQGNTVEQFVIFLPALWVAALYFPGWWAPILGLVWCLGRVVYAAGYMADPKKREVGFALTILPTLALLLLGIIGLVRAWLATA